MKKITLLAVSLLLCACAGNRTLDGETTKNWVTVVSSKVDSNGDINDVCYVLNLTFLPASVESRIDNNSSCRQQCCWYSENKTVDFYFNDGFSQEMAEKGFARHYEPEKLKIKMTYSTFLNTLYAKPSQEDLISSTGLVKLDYTDVDANGNSLYYDFDPSTTKNYKLNDTYKTVSMSGLNRPVPTEEEMTYDEDEIGYNNNHYNNAHNNGNYNNNNTTNTAPYTVAYTVPYDTKRVGETPNTYTNNVEEIDEEAEEYNKKLAYERNKAIELLAKYYGNEIDSYLLYIDKIHKKQGNVIYTNDRKWTATKIATPVYKVNCGVKAQIGVDDKNLKPLPINCGTYIVDLEEQTVTAKDDKAKKIVSGKY